MATNNKNFIVKNGIDVGQNATITGSLTASGLSYPVSDGDQYQAIVTDGAGNLSFGNVDTVESDVTNNTGFLIPKGTPVHQTGASGNTLTVEPSDASIAATMPAIGVAAEDIADGSVGRVIHFGYIRGIDTSAFSEGDRIFVADGGGYQVGRPTGEDSVVQFLGVVTKVHATAGSGVVFGGGRAHAVPNLNDGNIFIGNNLNTPTTATLDTSIVPENGNIYFTNQRAIDAIEGSTNLTIDGGTLYIDTANNYIGINDTSPQQALDITGAVAIGGTTVIDSGGEVVTAQLKDSGVTAGSYGSASLVPIITVDSKGRITSASTTSVAGVSNFTFNSTTDVLTISTADGGSYTSDISNITVGGSMDGPLANLTVKYQSTAPTSPSQGQIYFDSLNQLLMIYTGSSWVQTIPSSSGGGGTSGVTDAVATFQKYTYTLSSTTNAVSGASEQVVDAGDFTIGKSYQIRTVGDTDFTAIGASANTVGTVFVATGVGEGTGDAYTYLAYSTAGAQNVEVFVNGVKQVEGATNDYVATTGTAVTFTYNIPSGSVVDVQIYELLTQDAFYLKSETYTKTETNSQISSAVSAYLPLTGGTLTGALSGTSATLTGGLTVDTDTLVVDSTNNVVAIGGTVPVGTSKLHVDGSIDIKDGYNLTWGGDYTNNSPAIFASKTNEYLEIAPRGVGSSRRVRFNQTGVGVGTTTPARLMHLHASDARLHITNPVTGDAGTNGLMLGLDSANTNASLWNYSNGYLRFATNNINRLHITADGKIGINETNPNETLDVVGTMAVSGNVYHESLTRAYQPVYKQGTGSKYYTHLATIDAYNASGALLLRTKIPGHTTAGNGNMFQIRLTGFNYSNRGPIDLLIGVYAGENNWYSHYAYGTYDGSWANNINIGTDANGYVVIQLGATSMTQQCVLSVAEFTQGFTNTNPDYSKDWYFEAVTTLPTMTGVTAINKFGTEYGTKTIRYGDIIAPEADLRIGTSTTVYSASEQVSVNSNGVGIGIKGPTYGIGIWNTSTSGSLINFAYDTSGQSIGSISFDSSGTTYNTTSDRRMKDNIVTITDGKEKLLAMNPVTHTWKANPNTGETVHGFIAQEMQQIVPEAVTGDPNGEEMMSMDYGRITPVIVAALQDALKEIEELKERIKTLEAK